MKKFSVFKIGIMLALFILSTLACSFSQNSGSNPQKPPEVNSSNSPAPTIPPVVAATNPPQTPPTAAPTEGQKPNAYYEGISFYYDPALAKGVIAQTFEASGPATDNMPYFAIHPREYRFDFQGYLLGTGLKPQVLFFSPEEYAELAKDYGDANPVTKQVDKLKKLLADQPADSSGHLPFLMPEWNAGESFHAHLKYLKFQNGQGIRYLAEFGQAPTPLSNNLLCYVFQGFTDDGKYFVSAILPVNHPPLPGDTGEDMVKQDYSRFMETYPAYVVDIQNKLNAEKAETFTPRLDVLDAMIASIKIDR